MSVDSASVRAVGASAAVSPEQIMSASPPTRAARNAFAVLLLLLLPLFMYQAVEPIESDLVIEGLFYAAVGVYFASWYYYTRLGGPSAPAGEPEEGG